MINRLTTRPGQIVWINARAGRILGKVVKVNPKNIKVRDESGLTYTAHPTFLEETTHPEAAKWEAGSAPGPASPAPYASTGLFLGQVVRFKAPARHKGLYVVLGQHGMKYRVAKLGGDGNRYIRGVVPNSVENVDFDLAGV